MRILLIKTSSLGDVVHNLPVVSDLRVHYPGAEIDWVVEEAFADIPHLHPDVADVIPVAIRRWRSRLLDPATWREMGALQRRLRSRAYDLAIDTQGLVKSALIARQVPTRRCGYGASSAREPLASRFYDDRFAVSRDLHAVERNRRLAALACAYEIGGPPDYGIARPLANVATHAAVLLTATSRDDKLWPEQNWIELGRELNALGLTCRLPGGSTAERERCVRLAAEIPGAVAVPPSSLRDLAGELAAASIVVGVDTGLVHLAAALGRPTLALFCASNPALTGVFAPTPVVNLGHAGHPPGVADVLQTARRLLA